MTGELTFVWITAEAEKLIEEMPETDKRRVIATLKRPLRRDRAKKLRAGARFWRVRVTDRLRVTYCEHNYEPCVVYAGGHSDSDHYAEHSSGVIHRIKPLQECEFMNPAKDKRTELVTKAAAAAEKKPETVTAVTHVQPMSVGDLLQQAVQSLIDQQMVETIDLVRDAGDEQIQDVRQLVEGHSETLDKLTTRMEEVTASVSEVRATGTKVSSELQTLKTSHRDHAQRTTEQVAEVKQQIAQLHQQTQQRDNRLSAEVQQLATAVHTTREQLPALGTTVEAHDKSLAELRQELNSLEPLRQNVNVIDDLRQQVNSVAAGIEARMAVAQATATATQRGVATLERELATQFTQNSAAATELQTRVATMERELAMHATATQANAVELQTRVTALDSTIAGLHATIAKLCAQQLATTTALEQLLKAEAERQKVQAEMPAVKRRWFASLRHFATALKSRVKNCRNKRTNAPEEHAAVS